MSLTDQIYAQALLLSGPLEPRQEALLQMLCRGAERSLTARLRRGLTVDDCRSDLISAAGLYALAAFSETDSQVSGFTVGDVTIRQNDGSSAANCLRRQAELLILPYLQDGFSFVGV